MKIACLILGCRNFQGGTCQGCLRQLDAHFKPKTRCDELGVCQGSNCASCAGTAYPFAPDAIEHSRSKSGRLGTWARQVLRMALRAAIVLAVLLVLYLAWWWPEIWVDAQAKHARNMREAVSVSCTRESNL